MPGFDQQASEIAGDHMNLFSNSYLVSPDNPLKVTPSAVEAFEKQTGLKGIGQHMLKAGLWTLARESTGAE
jgi:hypothetical protein